MQESYRKNKTVAYFYDNEFGKHYYTQHHPMKPKRVSLTHSLVMEYGLYNDLDVYECRPAQVDEIAQFHDRDYLKYMAKYITPNNVNEEKKQKYKIGISHDCPHFEGVFNYGQYSSGASIDSAHLIIQQKAQIAINWSGGLHHAKKNQASGFCYINDIVLCILELLKYYPRVIYVDVDVHHGDGVEDAFFLSNRVMTVSFHEYGDGFFPGTGNIDCIGEEQGKYYCVNVPLKLGITDDQYEHVFKDIMDRVMDSYRPNVIVYQSGADSLADDNLGHFNLSTKGHGKCLEHMMKFGLPIILLGGGGYNIPNVARCWAYETGLCCGHKIEGKIPKTEMFYDLYAPDYKVHVTMDKNFPNKNSYEDLHKIKIKILEQLKELNGPPSMSLHHQPDLLSVKSDNDEISFEICEEHGENGEQKQINQDQNF